MDIKQVEEFTYLGITIDSKMSYNAQVRYVSSAATKKLWLLKHRLKNCTSATKLTAYKTVIRLILEYADIVWDPHTKTGIDIIESVQKRALRFIYNAYDWRISVTDLRSGLQTLETRRKMHRLQTMYNIANNHTKIRFHNYMQFITLRLTRGKHNQTILVPHARTNAYISSFLPKTIREWNVLPQSVVNSTTPNSFLSAVQTYL